MQVVYNAKGSRHKMLQHNGKDIIVELYPERQVLGYASVMKVLEHGPGEVAPTQPNCIDGFIFPNKREYIEISNGNNKGYRGMWCVRRDGKRFVEVPILAIYEVGEITNHEDQKKIRETLGDDNIKFALAQ